MTYCFKVWVAASFLLAALLGGCATTMPSQVEVPVATPCVKQNDIPDRPPLPSEDDLMKLDRNKRTLETWDEMLQLRYYSDQLRALLQACTGGK